MSSSSSSLVAVTRPNLPGKGIDRLASAAPVRIWDDDAPPTADDIVALSAGADVLLCVNGDPIDAGLLERCPSLQLVALASAGHDSVDVEAAADRNIPVTNTPGLLHEATADLAFALLLAARRRVVEADRYVRSGGWRRFQLTTMIGHDVHGSRLGIVGYGEIGRAVARRATGFGMEVRHHARTRADDGLSRWTGLDELLATSDVISVHTPLTRHTRGLIGERELRLMKPTATLVNTARGDVVDEPALIRALREGWIHSAGLDVQHVEPNPDPGDALLGLQNCVVLPHIGAATYAARAAMIDLAVDNVLAHLAALPLLSPLTPRNGAAR